MGSGCLNYWYICIYSILFWKIIIVWGLFYNDYCWIECCIFVREKVDFFIYGGYNSFLEVVSLFVYFVFLMLIKVRVKV